MNIPTMTILILPLLFAAGCVQKFYAHPDKGLGEFERDKMEAMGEMTVEMIGEKVALRVVRYCLTSSTTVKDIEDCGARERDEWVRLMAAVQDRGALVTLEAFVCFKHNINEEYAKIKECLTLKAPPEKSLVERSASFDRR